MAGDNEYPELPSAALQEADFADEASALVRQREGRGGVGKAVVLPTMAEIIRYGRANHQFKRDEDAIKGAADVPDAATLVSLRNLEDAGLLKGYNLRDIERLPDRQGIAPALHVTAIEDARRQRRMYATTFRLASKAIGLSSFEWDTEKDVATGLKAARNPAYAQALFGAIIDQDLGPGNPQGTAAVRELKNDPRTAVLIYVSANMKDVAAESDVFADLLDGQGAPYLLWLPKDMEGIAPHEQARQGFLTIVDITERLHEPNGLSEENLAAIAEDVRAGNNRVDRYFVRRELQDRFYDRAA